MNVTIECPLCKQAGRQTTLTAEVGSDQHWLGHCPNCGPVGGGLFSVYVPLDGNSSFTPRSDQCAFPPLGPDQ